MDEVFGGLSGGTLFFIYLAPVMVATFRGVKEHLAGVCIFNVLSLGIDTFLWAFLVWGAALLVAFTAPVGADKK